MHINGEKHSFQRIFTHFPCSTTSSSNTIQNKAYQYTYISYCGIALAQSW